MRLPSLLFGLLSLGVTVTPGLAQDRDRPRERPRDRAGSPDVRVFRMDHDEDRTVIGVRTTSSGERDTLGLLIVAVTPGSPAEQAGLEEGNRIAAINGVNLRLSAADAGEHDMNGLTTRRLVRELQKVDPGKDAELRVWSNGQYRNLKVKTIAAEDLPRRPRLSREEREDRPVLGLNLGGGGSRRDTLGILIVRVDTDGPAEKAGIVEGDRLVSINGVDLRSAREDAGDGWVSNAKANRFAREMRKVKVGDNVQLRVLSGGQLKNVTVKAARAGDLYKDRHFGTFFFSDGGDMELPPMPPIPPMPVIAPDMFEGGPMHIRPRIQIDGPDLDLDLDQFLEEVQEGLDEAAVGITKGARATMRALPRFEVDVKRARREAERALRRVPMPLIQTSWTGDFAGAPFAWPSASDRNCAIDLDGLCATPVNGDLASYLGKGSEEGLLILDADDRWPGVHAGDVLLSIDGRPVREDAQKALAIGAEEGADLVILRKGERVRVRIGEEARD